MCTAIKRVHCHILMPFFKQEQLMLKYGIQNSKDSIESTLLWLQYSGLSFLLVSINVDQCST